MWGWMKDEDGAQEDVIWASFLTWNVDAYKLYSQEFYAAN